MKKVTVVTGGAGFIGSHVCDKLIAQGERVICIDNFDGYYNPKIKERNIKNLIRLPEFKLVRADIRDREKIRKTFKTFKPKKVIHLAALAGVRNSIEYASEYANVNINGSISVLDASRNVGVENIIMASTSSIYGSTDKIPFKEDQATDRPLAPYPASKKAAELMAYSYHNMFKMNVTCLRFFTAYGPRVRPDMMSYMVMDKIVKNQIITLYDNNKMKRDWTYIDDVCASVILASNKPLGYEIINIGRGKPILLLDFINTIEKIVGKRAKLKIEKTPKSEPTVTFANIAKAKRLLKYRPSISIDEGLKSTWEWYKSSI